MQEELLNILNRYQSYFDIKKLNLVQFLLYCGPKDSWIVNQAAELAKQHCQQSDQNYWVITG